MHHSLRGISARILGLAIDALTRANTDAVFLDRGKEHRRSLAPLAAAHAGELLLKAMIAKEHPLLLFKNIGEKITNDEIDLNWLLKNGRTHDFCRLPSVLWATSGILVPDLESYKNRGTPKSSAALRRCTRYQHSTGVLTFHLFEPGSYAKRPLRAHGLPIPRR